MVIVIAGEKKGEKQQQQNPKNQYNFNRNKEISFVQLFLM